MAFLSEMNRLNSGEARSIRGVYRLLSGYGYLLQSVTVSHYLGRLHVWGIERSGFFNGREKWAKGFENQRV